MAEKNSENSKMTHKLGIKTQKTGKKTQEMADKDSENVQKRENIEALYERLKICLYNSYQIKNYEYTQKQSTIFP